MSSLMYYLDNFAPELLIIQLSLLVIITTFFCVVWFYNRRKYRNLIHQIPAGVVKTYLDSIIQNSISLKSSLFRGGGLDLSEGTGIPSVVPIGQLTSGTPLTVGTSSPEELNQRNAEISSLSAQLQEKVKTIQELEKSLGLTGDENKQLKGTIKQLESSLQEAKKGGGAVAAAPAAGGDSSELKNQLATVTKERDELKERLQEYEIIEDDLANLKRLQQENEQLKKALQTAGIPLPEGSAPATAPRATAPGASAAVEAPPVAEVAAAPVVEAVEEVPAAPPETETPPASEPVVAEAATTPVESSPAAPAEAPAAAAADANKSPEDLLSEFEKMLG